MRMNTFPLPVSHHEELNAKKKENKNIRLYTLHLPSRGEI